MKDHTGCLRGFVHYNEAWYSKAVKLDEGRLDEVSVGFYHPEGGTSGEFAVEWIALGDKMVPRLRAFDDAWSALSQFSDLLMAMGGVDDQNITPKAFCKLLLELGFKDRTQRHRTASTDPKTQALYDEREKLQAQLDALDRQIAGARR